AASAGGVLVSASTDENAAVSPRSGRNGANLGVRAALTASIAAERSSGWPGSGHSARRSGLVGTDSEPVVTSNRRSPAATGAVSRHCSRRAAPPQRPPPRPTRRTPPPPGPRGGPPAPPPKPPPPPAPPPHPPPGVSPPPISRAPSPPPPPPPPGG